MPIDDATEAEIRTALDHLLTASRHADAERIRMANLQHQRAYTTWRDRGDSLACKIEAATEALKVERERVSA